MNYFIADINARIRVIVQDKLDVKPEQVEDATYLSNELGADSLEILEIIWEIEKTFNIHIPDEDMEKLTSIGSMTNYVRLKTGEN